MKWAPLQEAPEACTSLRYLDCPYKRVSHKVYMAFPPLKDFDLRPRVSDVSLSSVHGPYKRGYHFILLVLNVYGLWFQSVKGTVLGTRKPNYRVIIRLEPLETRTGY